MKKIGILGGMGPQASIDFYRMLIEKSHMYNLGGRNQDYPAIVLSNIPVPDQIKGENDIHIALDMINREAKALEKTGAKFLVMPCNTMHLFIEDIMHGIKIPFISMIESVVEQIKKSGFKKIGLLGSTTTMKSHLYISPLNNLGIKIIIPEKEKHDSISQTIHNYIAGKSNQKDVKLLEKYSNELVESGAEVIILGCTELPLILKNSLGKYNFLASSEILAEKTIQYSQT